MIWRANRSSAKATQESVNLSETIYKQQQKEKQILGEQYLSRIIKRTESLIKLYETFIDINVKNIVLMIQCPLDYGDIDTITLPYIDQSSLKIINEIWERHMEFINKYYLNAKGEWITSFRGNVPEEIYNSAAHVYNDIFNMFQEIKK